MPSAKPSFLISFPPAPAFVFPDTDFRSAVSVPGYPTALFHIPVQFLNDLPAAFHIPVPAPGFLSLNFSESDANVGFDCPAVHLLQPGFRSPLSTIHSLWTAYYFPGAVRFLLSQPVRRLLLLQAVCTLYHQVLSVCLLPPYPVLQCHLSSFVSGYPGQQLLFPVPVF